MRTNSTAVRSLSPILYGTLLLASSAAGQVLLASDDALSAASPELTATVNCPPGALPEAEPCGSDVNGGCDMLDPVFEPLACNSTLCGTYWFDGYTRDTDWFEVVLTSPQQLTATIFGEAETIVGFIEQINPGVPGCDNTTGYFSQSVIAPPLTPGTIVSECLLPGTYYVWAGSTFAFAFPCPADYVLTLDCEPCTTPLGACCVDTTCVGTMEEHECDALGGYYFFVGHDCATGFVCPGDCLHRIVLYDAFGDGWNGNTLDVYVDGILMLNQITLPSGPGPLAFEFLAETGAVIQTIYYPIGSWPYEPYYIIYDAGGYFLGQDGGNFVQPVGITVTANCMPSIVGACCYADGSCERTTPDACVAGEFLGLGSQCFQCPCVVVCPPAAVSENEPCGTSTNAGCGADPPAFEPIACNTIVCGTGYYQSDDWDTDWYVFVAPNTTTMIWSVEAEFPVLTGRVAQSVPGMPGCDNLAGGLEPYGEAGPCEQVSVTFDVVAGGTYYLWVGPTLDEVYACPADYVAVLIGYECLCGDFDMDNDVDVMDYYAILGAFGTCTGQPMYLAAADADGDGCITLVDYQSWLVCYIEANGAAFEPPAPAPRDESRAAQ